MICVKGLKRNKRIERIKRTKRIKRIERIERIERVVNKEITSSICLSIQLYNQLEQEVN